ncbi:MAG TPA: pyridoxal phosphate-dependent aminotransferase family protein [Planctomycetes bacterium]|nr:pyridoxal phosphate-dependent aminotransferase family protein [Planctomycetota bacterium]
MDLFDKCQRFDRAKKLINAGLYPFFREIQESGCTRVTVNGRELVMVGSNNYLGLTHHPRVLEAAREALGRYGSSCTGSRFLNGTLSLHEELEERLARFMGYPSCVTFPTGFQVNLGVISALCSKGDIIFCDKENHASIVDGCRLAYAEVLRFRHGDMADLEAKLANAPKEAGKLVVVDGVFSMLGRITNLPEVVRIAKKYGARVMVDDAHGVGVLGAHGKGTTEHFDMMGPENGVDIVAGTFSKSLASIGGFVVANEDVIHYVKHLARSLMFSASVSPPNAASALAALDVIETEPEILTRLWKNVDKMMDGLATLGFDTMGSSTPIIPINIGGELETFQVARNLYEAGLFVNPVVPPGAPRGLIRTSYMAAHTEEDLDFALDVFQRLASRFKVAANQ